MKKYLKIKAEKFSNLVTDINLKIQGEQTPNGIKPKEFYTFIKHHSQTPENLRQRKSLESSEKEMTCYL